MRVVVVAWTLLTFRGVASRSSAKASSSAKPAPPPLLPPPFRSICSSRARERAFAARVERSSSSSPSLSSPAPSPPPSALAGRLADRTERDDTGREGVMAPVTTLRDDEEPADALDIALAGRSGRAVADSAVEDADRWCAERVKSGRGGGCIPLDADAPPPPTLLRGRGREADVQAMLVRGILGVVEGAMASLSGDVGGPAVLTLGLAGVVAVAVPALDTDREEEATEDARESDRGVNGCCCAVLMCRFIPGVTGVEGS